jgi:hypothetical protein
MLGFGRPGGLPKAQFLALGSTERCASGAEVLRREGRSVSADDNLFALGMPMGPPKAPTPEFEKASRGPQRARISRQTEMIVQFEENG